MRAVLKKLSRSLNRFIPIKPTFAQLERSVVRIVHLSADGRPRTSATAWFYRPNILVTAAHAATRFREAPTKTDVTLERLDGDKVIGFSTKGWLVMAGGLSISIDSSGIKVLRNLDTDIAAIELEEEIPDVYVPQIRTTTIPIGSTVYGIGYPHGDLTLAKGKMLEYGGYHGSMILNFADQIGKRDIMTLGASGTPVFDEDGRVAGVISALVCATPLDEKQPTDVRFPKDATNIATNVMVLEHMRVCGIEFP